MGPRRAGKASGHDGRTATDGPAHHRDRPAFDGPVPFPSSGAGHGRPARAHTEDRDDAGSGRDGGAGQGHDGPGGTDGRPGHGGAATTANRGSGRGPTPRSEPAGARRPGWPFLSPQEDAAHVRRPGYVCT